MQLAGPKHARGSERTGGHQRGAKQGAVLAYGAFLTKLVNFLIIAWILFLVVKGINQLRRQFEKDKAPPPPAETPADVKLLSEIRDLLAAEAKPAAAKK